MFLYSVMAAGDKIAFWKKYIFEIILKGILESKCFRMDTLHRRKSRKFAWGNRIGGVCLGNPAWEILIGKLDLKGLSGKACLGNPA